MPRLLAVATLLVLAVLARTPSSTHQAGPRPDLESPATDGEVLVRLHPSFLALPAELLGRRLGGEVVARLPEVASVRLRLAGDETPVDAIERLRLLPGVVFVEPNLRLSATTTTAALNDPLYDAESTYLDLMRATQAWEVERGDPAVLVAVLDSGIDLTHPDLQGKVWTNPLEVEGDGVDNDMDGCVDDLHGCSFVSSMTADPSCPPLGAGNVDDDNGHGTFVSGLIAANANNGIGIAGAAPGVTILPVKILDCKAGGTAAEAAQAILYAAKLGARVANISFGADGESQTLASAIREAHDRYGMVIVAATGNAGKKGVTFPARLPQAIAVASSGTVSNQDNRSDYSDWGPEVAFAAPGLNIVSTVPEAACHTNWFCLPDGPYALSSGTSFAAPFVSALAALLVSHTPNLSPETVRSIIAQAAHPLPDGDAPNWDGAGRIDMSAALSEPRYFLGAPGVGRH